MRIQLALPLPFLVLAAACSPGREPAAPPPILRGDAGLPDAAPPGTDAGSTEDAGVVGEDAAIAPPTKAEARLTAGSWDRDWCEELGWYDDGECDDFCPEADAACWSEDDRHARELVRGRNATDEAMCQIKGILKNDDDGTFYWGRLELFDAPPASCEIVAEAGACFVRRCVDAEVGELPIDPELEAGVGFVTNQSRWSSNPWWSAGSANTFSMPARGADFEIGWKYDGVRETVVAPGPSVVSEVSLRGDVSLDADLWVDLTYQRTAAEEAAAESTATVRVTGSELEFSGWLEESIECLVPDTQEAVRVDASLLRAIGLDPGDFVRVEAGGYLMRFADLGECRGQAVVAKYPRGRESFVSVRTQVAE